MTSSKQILDTNITTRLYNCLTMYNLCYGTKFHTKSYLNELSEISIKNFLKCRRVGLKSLNELQELCTTYDIELKE